MEGPPVLRAPRLLLRPFCIDDVDDVYGYASDPEFGGYLEFPDPRTRRGSPGR